LARLQRIESDHAQCADIECVLDEFAAAVQFRTVGEGGAQRGPVVVIADQQKVGQFKRREQRLQVFVLLRIALIDEVAGDDHGVRTGNECVQRSDATREIRGGVDAAIGEPAGPLDMQVANLSQQHGIVLV